MADGKIEYELSIETQRAVAAITRLNADAIRTGKILNDGSAEMSAGLNNAANNVEKLSNRLDKIPLEKMKSLSLLAAGAATQLAASALQAGGFEKQAGYLTSALSGAAQLGAAGFMVGGPIGAAIGGAAGAVVGAGRQFFNNAAGDVAAMEAEGKLYASMAVSAEAANRSISRLTTPKELQDAIAAIDEKMKSISRSAEFGLIPSATADRMTRDLAGQRDLASSLIPGAQAAEGEARAAKLLSAITASSSKIQDNREKSAFDNSLDGAKNAAEKVALIDARFAKLTETAAGLADKLSDPAVVTGPEDAAAALLSQIEAIDSELNSLSGRRASTLSGKDLGNESVRSVQTDALTRIGAVLNGGSMTSAANDYARVTSGNTARMVSLLEKISDKPGATSGGAVWAA